MLIETLHDGAVVVRPFRSTDAVDLIAGRDDESRRFLGEGSPNPEPVAVIEVDGRTVGWIDFDDEREWLEPDQVNVGYGIFPSERRRRFGTRALRLLSAYLMGLDPPLRPTLLIDPQNAASLHLAANAGFVEVRQLDGEIFFELPTTR